MGFFSELVTDANDAYPAKANPDRPREPKPCAAVPPESRITDGPETGTEKAERLLVPEPGPEKDIPTNGEVPPDGLTDMSDEDAAMLSVQRVSTDTERITRRNMKDCVSEHIQALCREDPGFARRVLHPRKTMVNCFKYIYRKAQEYVRQEMKDLGEKPVSGVYGIDVPDGLCYQWAEAYFNDPDAPEDQDKAAPKAVSNPVPGMDKAPAPKPARKKSQAAVDGQISLLGEAV